MRHWILPLAAVVLTGSLASAQTPPPVSDEVKAFAGHYKPSSVEYDGKQQLNDPKTKQQLTLVVEGSEYRAYFAPDPAKNEHFRLFTADLAADLAADAAAKTFTLSIKDGAKKGEQRHGIYKLEGSTLTICYGPAAKPRPTTFAAPPGSEYFLEVWTRNKR